MIARAETETKHVRVVETKIICQNSATFSEKLSYK